MRLAVVSILISLSSNLLSCSDSEFAANERTTQSSDKTSKKRTPKEKPVTETKAVEPTVIIGAYLTCSSLENHNPNMSSYGCALRSKDHLKVDPPSGFEIDIVAQSGVNVFAPVQQPLGGTYHAVFEINNLLSDDLFFGAALRSASASPTEAFSTDLPYQFRIPRSPPQPPNPPTFNIDSSVWVKAGTDLIVMRVPKDHSVHWTYTHDLSEKPENPDCQSEKFGDADQKITISRHIKLRAIVCSPGGLRSNVRELEFKIPVNQCACKK